MKVQIINFGIEGISEAELEAVCDQLAPQFADLPGLLSKVWLRDSTHGTYGGVYLWTDEGSLERFRAGELYQAVAEHPNLSGITDSDFDVFDGPTTATRGFPTLAAS